MIHIFWKKKIILLYQKLIRTVCTNVSHENLTFVPFSCKTCVPLSCKSCSMLSYHLLCSVLNVNLHRPGSPCGTKLFTVQLLDTNSCLTISYPHTHVLCYRIFKHSVASNKQKFVLTGLTLRYIMFIAQY